MPQLCRVDLTCPAICNRENKLPTSVWRQHMEGWGWLPSVQGDAGPAASLSEQPFKRFAGTHFPEISLTLHKPQAHIPCLATSKQEMLSGEPRFLCGTWWPHLASWSTEVGATLAYVPKYLGHFLIQTGDSRSICGRKEREGGREKSKRKKGKEGKWE